MSGLFDALTKTLATEDPSPSDWDQGDSEELDELLSKYETDEVPVMDEVDGDLTASMCVQAASCDLEVGCVAAKQDVNIDVKTVRNFLACMAQYKCGANKSRKN